MNADRKQAEEILQKHWKSKFPNQKSGFKGSVFSGVFLDLVIDAMLEFHQLSSPLPEITEENIPLGLNNPYPTTDVLERLAQAAEYLLHENSYDGPDYEEIEICVKRAREIIKEIYKQKNKPIGEPEQLKNIEITEEEIMSIAELDSTYEPEIAAFIRGFNACLSLPSERKEQRTTEQSFIPTEGDIKSLKRLKGHFGEHDKTLFEHRAFAVIDSLIEKLTGTKTEEQQKGAPFDEEIK
jgi:hypothetical protein